jgi:hypothetical protein
VGRRSEAERPTRTTCYALRNHKWLDLKAYLYSGNKHNSHISIAPDKTANKNTSKSLIIIGVIKPTNSNKIMMFKENIKIAKYFVPIFIWWA